VLARSSPVLGITIGDPFGIGPEIIVATLLDAATSPAALGACVRLYAHADPLFAAARVLGREGELEALLGRSGVGLVTPEIGALDLSPPREPTSTRAGGVLSFAAVERAISDAKRPVGDAERIDAIVTAPISKTSWRLAGITEFPGHTELLAARFDAPESGMLFVGPSLRVVLATIHVPLARVASVLSTRGVLSSIRLAHRACEDLGEVSPRIGVCGLNPHAGEGGLLGEEDGAVIAPAVARAREEGIDAWGPLPADTIFGAGVLPPRGPGRFGALVAMYHDQGLIPVKLLDGRLAVNVTAGLATVRTSPAHGTAFDIAGRGRADPTSMAAAMRTAVGLLASRAGRG
jgi:4-hydroxythreonine-4-phosphate dehydrogenase